MNTTSKPSTSKPKIKKVSEKNEIIRSLAGLDYIKNPFVYSQIRGNFTLMQSRILIAIVASLQKKISERMVCGVGIVGPVITNPYVEIEIAELGINQNQYNDLEMACEALIHMDGIGFSYKENGTTRYKKMSVFTGYDIPIKETKTGRPRRSGIIKVSLNAEAMGYLFNTSNQYIEHVANIALISRCPRTPRLYLFLSAFRKNSKEREVSYLALKEFLGFLDFYADHERVKEDRAPAYFYFKRDVIEPARKELKKLCDKGDVEFYFDYEPVYDTRKTRGVEPSKIRFKLIQGTGKPQIEEATLVDNTPVAHKPLTGADLKCFLKNKERIYTLAESGNGWAKGIMNGEIAFAAEDFEKESAKNA